jgi:hypothetical protein
MFAVSLTPNFSWVGASGAKETVSTVCRVGPFLGGA